MYLFKKERRKKEKETRNYCTQRSSLDEVLDNVACASIPCRIHQTQVPKKCPGALFKIPLGVILFSCQEYPVQATVLGGVIHWFCHTKWLILCSFHGDSLIITCRHTSLCKTQDIETQVDIKVFAFLKNQSNNATQPKIKKQQQICLGKTYNKKTTIRPWFSCIF